MRVFISHKQEDAEAAVLVKRMIEQGGHTGYLDIIDRNIGMSGDDLSDYIRDRLGECDSLIAVVSHATRLSWWVPWEIGIATEKDYPLSTYLPGALMDTPDYLKKWPVLRSTADLQQFANKARELEVQLRKSLTQESKSVADARKKNTPDFHRALKKAIGQP